MMSNPKILLVDDRRDIVKMLLRRLKRVGLSHIRTAGNGQEGVRIALSWQPALILMDMHMPIMSGYAATEELRRAEYTGVIIALTAGAMTDDRDKALAAGCDRFITKPIGLDFEDQLLAILKEHGLWQES